MTQTIGFLIYPGVEELDLVGPWEIATMWRDYADGPECVTVAEKIGPHQCAKGMTITADTDFTTCPNLDVLLIPGGFSAFDEMNNEALLSFVKQVDETADHMMSVCSGSFILLKAGLLQDRKATTHWKAIETLRENGVAVVEERFVRDGRIWTSAGVSAGIDLMLHFIAQTVDHRTADIVAHNAEYYPARTIYGDLHKDSSNPAYMQRLFHQDPTA